MRLQEEKLPDRVAVGEDHQHQHDRVPEPKSIECWRNAHGRIHGKRIAHRLVRRTLTKLRAHQDDDQQDRRAEQNQAANDRDDDEGAIGAISGSV